MTFIDKICVLEANSVTTKEFERTWGISMEEYLSDLKDFVMEQRTFPGVHSP